MSGDAEQEYFSDGISEDIITDLSKVGGLVVIARNSSFAYKGKNVDLRVSLETLSFYIGGAFPPPGKEESWPRGRNRSLPRRT